MAKTGADAMQARAETGFDDVFFSAPDGLRLHARFYRRPEPEARERLPLVCLPGLTRNVRDFHALATFLAFDAETPRRVVSFDYRGRGGSDRDRDPARYTILVEAEDVLAGLAALGIERAIFLGTSRGGLIMHALAAMRPTVMAAGILNDIGPVIEGAGLAQIKAYLTRAPKPKTWDEAAAIQKEVHGKAFPALGESDWADFARAIYVETKNGLVADYDPALLDGLKDMNFSVPLPTLWPQFDALATRPLMVLRGENSKLLSEETVAAMKARAPHIETRLVRGHGHAPVLHLSGLPGIIGSFLRAVDRKQAS